MQRSWSQLTGAGGASEAKRLRVDDAIPDSDEDESDDEVLRAHERAELRRLNGEPGAGAENDAVRDDDDGDAQILARVESQLDRLGLPSLTDEQKQLVQHRPAPGERVVVNAFAGTGKTTACRILAERFARQRVLYVVFNKAAKEEAEQVMPSNVECRTTHSLAHQFVREQLLPRGARLSVNRRPPGLDGYRDWAVVRTLENFFSDPDHDAPDQHAHLPADMSAARGLPTLQRARAVWIEMHEGRASHWTFDALLKYFAVERQQSHRWVARRCDVLLVDEAQDTQSVLMPWYAGVTRVPVYLIGDTHQSIYGFNGARNAMEHALALPHTRDFALTRSFRFGNGVAEMATQLLRIMRLIDANVEIRGNPARRTCVEWSETASPDNVDEVGSLTFIARTNASIIKMAFKAADKRKSVRLIGRTRDTLRKVEETLNRYAGGGSGGRRRRGGRGGRRYGGAGRTMKQRLNELERRYRNFERGVADEPLTDAEEEERLLLTVIVQYGAPATRRLLRNVKQTAGSPSADVTLCTVHAAKGLQFGCVAILDDFQPLAMLQAGLQMLSADDGTENNGAALLSHLMSDAASDAVPRSLRTMLRRQSARGLTIRQQLVEEVHLYYVAMTRPTDLLYVNAELARFFGRARVTEADDEE